MEENEPVVDDDDRTPVEKTFASSHLVLKILADVIEYNRKKLFVIGTRSRLGDLAGILELRLVNKQFNQAVISSVRVEFKNIEIEIDEYYMRVNEFTIGRHLRPVLIGENQNENGENPGNQMPAPEELPSEDALNALYLRRFFQWLADTFDPAVEKFKIFDSWSFKPCSIPATWVNRLSYYNCMHPDMDYCNCAQCVQIARNCKQYFGPMSFQMAQDSLRGQQLSYTFLSCTDSFLADVALAYTENVGDGMRFNADRFVDDYGNIRCENIIFAVQTLPSYRDEHPKPQPLEVIQLIIKLWEVKSAEFEVVKFMENEFYAQRWAWANTEVFHKAYFATYTFDAFNDGAHVTPYREAGKVDKDLRYDFLPIFDLRIDPCDGPFRMGSNLSLLSLASQNNSNGNFSWVYQGRIAFNMFRSTRFLFISAGVMDFRGTLGTCNWLKYTIRDLMRSAWGPRDRLNVEMNKVVYWIHFMEDVNECFPHVWKTHAEQLIFSNFPNLNLRMNTKAFENCDNPRITEYNDAKRPDVLKESVHNYYLSFYDPIRNNHTHIKLIQIDN